MKLEDSIMLYCSAKGLRYDQFDNFSNYYQQGFEFDASINQFKKLHCKDLKLLEKFMKGTYTLPVYIYKDDIEGYGAKALRAIKKKEIVVIYCGDVVKNKYVEKLKLNEYCMNFVESLEDQQGFSICPVQHWSAGMILNHSSSQKLKNVAFTQIIGPNNKPLHVGYAIKDIKKDDILRYEYNGSRPGLYDTQFPDQKAELRMVMDNLEIDLMLLPQIPEDIQKKFSEIQIQTQENEVPNINQELKSQRSLLDRAEKKLISFRKELKMHEMVHKIDQGTMEADKKRIQQLEKSIFNFEKLAQMRRYERDRSHAQVDALVQQLKSKQRVQSNQIGQSKKKSNKFQNYHGLDVDSIIATYKVQFLSVLFPSIFNFCTSVKNQFTFSLNQKAGNNLLLTSTLFNVYIPQQFKYSIIRLLEKEVTIIPAIDPCVINYLPLVMPTSRVIEILKQVGVHEVRILRVGLKMLMGNFLDLFDNEWFVASDSNRVDVAFSDCVDCIQSFNLAEARACFQGSHYFQDYPLMSKKYGTFNLQYEGKHNKIYSSFSHLFRGKILGPQGITQAKLANGLYKTFRFCMSKTFKVYTRYETSSTGKHSMEDLVKNGADIALSLFNKVKQNLKPVNISLSDYDLLKKEAFDRFAAYYHKKNSWPLKIQKYKFLLWEMGWSIQNSHTYAERSDVFQRIQGLNRTFIIEEKIENQLEKEYSEEEEVNLRNQMKQYLSRINKIVSDQEKMTKHVAKILDQKAKKSKKIQEEEVDFSSSEEESQENVELKSHNQSQKVEVCEHQNIEMIPQVQERKNFFERIIDERRQKEKQREIKSGEKPQWKKYWTANSWKKPDSSLQKEKNKNQ